MLRRFTLGFCGLVVAITIAACSNNTNPISIGPNFPTATLYATNSTQSAVSIFPPGTKSGSGPQNQIVSATLVGPQYLAFDPSSNLWVSTFSPSAGGSIVEIKALATGNVSPLLTSAQVGLTVAHPRGLAFLNVMSAGTTTPFIVAANVDPTQRAFSNELLVLSTANNTLSGAIVVAGPATGLNVPSGVAVDTKQNVYVTNLQGASVEQFVLPIAAPTATASPAPTPTAVATATPTPLGATPSPIPTITPDNISPSFTIAGGATGLTAPTGVAVDMAGNVYVSDQGNPTLGVAPSILVFPPNLAGTVNSAPIRKITGSSTMLFAPTDVKVDGTGQIYVADSTAAGAGIVYIFAPTANGNVAPTTTFTSPGTVIGLALAP